MGLLDMLPNLEDALAGAGKMMDELKAKLTAIQAYQERIEARLAVIEGKLDEALGE